MAIARERQREGTIVCDINRSIESVRNARRGRVVDRAALRIHEERLKIASDRGLRSDVSCSRVHVVDGHVTPADTILTCQPCL